MNIEWMWDDVDGPNLDAGTHEGRRFTIEIFLQCVLMIFSVNEHVAYATKQAYATPAMPRPTCAWGHT